MIPHSTYRLQLHAGFPFSAVQELIPYLERLGIGAVYLSPILLSRPGSQHGYDICDHNRLNPELGGEEGFRELSSGLKGKSLGCIIDFVPNHMGADPASNPWWWDVLENGPSSPFAAFFDIDWEPLKPDLKGKVLLPVLGDQYGRILERGELQLALEAGALVLRYYEHRFPINPRMSPMVLLPDTDDGSPAFDESGEDGIEYLSILTSLRNLPAYQETDPARIRERQREKEVARKRMAALLERSAAVAAYVDSRISVLNGTAGKEQSFDRLHELLEKQTYRLAYWRTAGHEINYRRFFDINSLLGIRMEHPEAFQATHERLLRLFHEGDATGVRLDHVDGLYDPAGYLRRLRESLEATASGAGEGAPAGARPISRTIYIVAEKILTGGETLRPDWPIQGTTGYEYLNDINGLFVDRAGMDRLDKQYRRFTLWNGTFRDSIRDCKRLILATSLGSELNVLANMVDRLSEADRNSRDFTLEALRDALREVIAAFPIYRTYADGAGFSEEDKTAIDSALRSAALENPAMEPSIFLFLRAVLLPWEDVEGHGPGESIAREKRLNVAIKFQQLTSPVQAKGVEDTAFYRHAPLLSLNEVGGDPAGRGLGAAAFHARISERSKAFPFGMIATATHDTKRGEDARARLNVLTSMPDDWRRLVSRLSTIADSCQPAVTSGAARVTREDEALIFQTLLACWPMGEDGNPAPCDSRLRDRVLEFMIKAAREAKTDSSWINPNEAYEKALEGLLDGLLTGRGSARFLAALPPFIKTVAPLGMLRSLSQLALKCGLPGVPDIYQGAEHWDLSLVDPDNRRPVDYSGRIPALEKMEPWIAPDSPGRDPDRREWALGLLGRWPDGEIKQYVTARTLRWRKEHSDLFLKGGYRPLIPDSGAKSGWIAFAREGSGKTLIVCVRILGNGTDRPVPAWTTPPSAAGERLPLPPEWGEGNWINLFTGTSFAAHAAPAAHGGQAGQVDSEGPKLDLAEIGRDFPIAWLIPSAF